ncbi:MAG: hypothetical protein WEE50_06380 [Chloroflexota bacterium]
MTDELVRTAAIGVAAALLGFELVVAARSWYDAWSTEHDRDPAAPWLGRTDHGHLLLSQAFAIRDHVAERRRALTASRRRYAVLRTNRYGRQLRGAIGCVRTQALSHLAAACPSCRAARLKGQRHCLECGRSLIVPAIPAGA